MEGLGDGVGVPDPPEPAQVAAEYATTLTGERSEIGTIHSFAGTLLRLYPMQSGVDPQFVEDDGRHVMAARADRHVSRGAERRSHPHGDGHYGDGRHTCAGGDCARAVEMASAPAH